MLAALIPVIGPIIDKLVDRIPDPAAREKAKLEAEATLLAASIGQVSINIEEAKNPNVWVSGWRPAIGWACACAFAFLYVVGPVVVWVASWYGATITLPQFNSADLMSLTFGMLGIAGFRTFEKVKGVAR